MAVNPSNVGVYVGAVTGVSQLSGTFDEVRYTGVAGRVYPTAEGSVDFENMRPARPFSGETRISAAAPVGSPVFLVSLGKEAVLTVFLEEYETTDCEEEP